MAIAPHDPHGIDVDATATSIRLASGDLIDLAAPDPSKMHLADVARSLARQERFTGHCPLRPTVAAHSLAVEYIARRIMPDQWGENWLPDPRERDQIARAALMHDATEAYCSDVSAPAKRAMRVLGGSDFDVLEARLVPVIAERFRCAVPEGWAGLIHAADVMAYQYESSWRGWGTALPPQWVSQDPYVRSCYLAPGGGPYRDGGEYAFKLRARRLGIPA